jgi:hypothetical protein
MRSALATLAAVAAAVREHHERIADVPALANAKHRARRPLPR